MESNQPVTPPIGTDPKPNSGTEPRTFHGDFERGYVGGLENINKSSYESYLASFISLEDCEHKIEAKRQEIRALEAEIAQVRSENQRAFDTLEEHKQQHSLKAGKANRFQERLGQIRTEETAIQERRHQTNNPYSLLAGALYLAAGLVFMFGDLIISHEIVAYALNIRNTFEAWSFALGLAALSVLFKPAYERLFETPYTREPSERTKKRYVWFKGILVVFAIATLFILGWFRYEAYKADKLKENINKTIRSLQMDDSPEALQKIEQQLQTVNALNLELVNSPWAMASFILTGILFAVAGAVCLGIAFPVLQGYWQRWLQLDWRLGRLKRERKKLIYQLESLEGDIASHQTNINTGERQLTSLPVLPQLSERLVALRRDLEKLGDDRKFAETDCRIAAFNDGYERGLMREKLGQFYPSVDNQMERDNPLDRPAKEERKASGSTERNRYATRPYLAIRKMIATQFDNDSLS